MASKPSTAAGYPPELAAEARRMCLFVATILGDILEDIVVVGGLVPYLIVDQHDEEGEPHVGTRDLDLGLSLGVLDDELYKQISARLRERGFTQGTNEQGNPTRQTWTLPGEDITIDFLIPPSEDGPRPGRLQNLEADFAAIVTPALPLAFQDCIEVEIEDITPKGEVAKRAVRVCGPAAFVVMKAHAFRLRGENKDAYDLVYVLMNYGEGDVRGVSERFTRIANDGESARALTLLEEDFASVAHVGPRRAAEFLATRDDDEVRADAFGYVAEFLRLVSGLADTP